MPAAAVIPAPIAYTKGVAVKKLVVGFLCGRGTLSANRRNGYATPAHPVANHAIINLVAFGDRLIYFEKNRVFKAGISP